MRPRIIITEIPELKELGVSVYAIQCHGQDGGGFSIPQITQTAVTALLAEYQYLYDLGDERVLIIAPDEINRAAGLL